LKRGKSKVEKVPNCALITNVVERGKRGEREEKETVCLKRWRSTTSLPLKQKRRGKKKRRKERAVLNPKRGGKKSAFRESSKTSSKVPREKEKRGERKKVGRGPRRRPGGGGERPFPLLRSWEGKGEVKGISPLLFLPLLKGGGGGRGSAIFLSFVERGSRYYLTHGKKGEGREGTKKVISGVFLGRGGKFSELFLPIRQFERERGREKRIEREK